MFKKYLHSAKFEILTVWAIAVFVFLAPFRLHTQGAKSIAYAIIIVYLLSHLSKLKVFLIKNKPMWVLVIITIIISMSIGYSVSSYETIHALRKWLKLVVILWAIALLSVNSKYRDYIIVAVALGGAVVSSVAMFNFYAGIPDSCMQFIPHAFELVHVGLSKFMICIVPFGLWLFLSSKKYSLYFWIGFYSFASAILVVFSGIARGGWVALVCSVIPLLFLFKKQIFRRRMILFFVVFCLSIIVNISRINNRIVNDGHTSNKVLSAEIVTEGQNGLLKGRPLFWRVGLNMWSDSAQSMLFGTGFGWHNFKSMFVHRYKMLYPNKPIFEVPSHMHNFYISLLLQLGIVGVVLFLYFFIYLLSIAKQLLVSVSLDTAYLSSLMFISLFMAFMFQSLIEEVSLDQEGLLFFAMAGLLMATKSEVCDE